MMFRLSFKVCRALWSLNCFFRHLEFTTSNICTTKLFWRGLRQKLLHEIMKMLRILCFIWKFGFSCLLPCLCLRHCRCGSLANNIFHSHVWCVSVKFLLDIVLLCSVHDLLPKWCRSSKQQLNLLVSGLLSHITRKFRLESGALFLVFDYGM